MSEIPTVYEHVRAGGDRRGTARLVVPRMASMDFGQALTHLRAGDRLARSGWNGAGMWVVFQAGYPDGVPLNRNTAEATGIAEGTVCVFRPYLMMFTADGQFVPWVASQSDLLADDWLIARAAD